MKERRSFSPSFSVLLCQPWPPAAFSSAPRCVASSRARASSWRPTPAPLPRASLSLGEDRGSGDVAFARRDRSNVFLPSRSMLPRPRRLAVLLLPPPPLLPLPLPLLPLGAPAATANAASTPPRTPKQPAAATPLSSRAGKSQRRSGSAGRRRAESFGSTQSSARAACCGSTTVAARAARTRPGASWARTKGFEIEQKGEAERLVEWRKV